MQDNYHNKINPYYSPYNLNNEQINEINKKYDEN
jgi:hypothetical protein